MEFHFSVMLCCNLGNKCPDATSGGFKVGGGPEARLKRGAPLMTLSYSANRDMHFDQA